jgi:hypothetical protein
VLSGDFRVDFWAKIDDHSQSILIRGSETTAGSGNFLSSSQIVTRTGELVVRGGSQNALFNYNILGASDVLLNTWYHYSVRRVGSSYTLYRDGVLIGTLTGQHTNDLELGGFGNTNDGRGFLKDVAYFNHVPDIDLYNNPNKFVELCRANNAVLAYDCNQGVIEDGGVLIDSSGNNNHGACYGVNIGATNNESVGSQPVTHGWSLYKKFTGTIGDTVDILTNANLFTSGIDNATMEFDFQFLDVSGASSDKNVFFNPSGDVGSPFILVSDSGSFTAGNHTVGVGDPTVTIDGGATVTSRGDLWSKIGDLSPHTARIVGIDFTLDNGWNNGIELNGYGLASNFTLSNIIISEIRIDLNSDGNWDHIYNGRKYNFKDSVGSDIPVVTPSQDVILVPAIKDSGAEDIFGNTVTRPWKEGLLNFTPFAHDGIQLGSAVGELDASMYTGVLLYKNYADENDSSRLFQTRAAGEGITWRLNTGDFVSFFNEKGAFFSDDSNKNFTGDDTPAVIAFTLESDATLSFYDGDESTAMALDNFSPASVGTAVGQGTVVARIGSQSGSEEISNLVGGFLLFNNKKTLAELETLRKYIIKLIP